MKVFFLCLMAFSLFGMTLEEKVGQMLMVHFHGEEINDDARQLIDKARVGGFIFYNWSNGELAKGQVKKLCHDLQGYSPTPLFLTVDQEGGRVQRLKNGFTRLPRPALMDRPFEYGQIVGRELKAVGINLNQAPVVEPYLDDRSMGLSAEKFIDGMQAQGLIGCLKHFPGHGDGSIDPHEGLPIAKALDMRAFEGLLLSADAVMTAHVLVPSVDPKYCATVSKKWIWRLRNEFGFQGVLISDSLIMEGLIQNTGDIKNAVLQAALAGVDVLLLGGKDLTNKAAIGELTLRELLDIHSYLVDCVRKGILDEAQIDKSVSRIMKLKKKMALDCG